MEEGHSVLPHKVWREAFMADGRQIVLGKFIGELLYMEG